MKPRLLRLEAVIQEPKVAAPEMERETDTTNSHTRPPHSGDLQRIRKTLCVFLRAKYMKYIETLYIYASIYVK